MADMNRAMNAYTKNNIDSVVAAASPHQLISLLIDGSIRFLNSAKFHMQKGDIPQKGVALSRAIGCIEGGLRAGLNKELGGKLAENLDALYDYMSHRLLMANIKNDVTMLDEVNSLLHELKEGWDKIGVQPELQTPTVPSSSQPNRDQTSYGKA